MAIISISGVRGVRKFHGVISPLVRYYDDDCFENLFETYFHPEPDGRFEDWEGMYIFNSNLTYDIFDHICSLNGWLDHFRDFVKDTFANRNGVSAFDFSELFESGPRLGYGPHVCKKLAADFAKWDSIIRTEWGPQGGYKTFAKIKECFEYAAAAEDGAVVFISLFFAPTRIRPRRRPSRIYYGDEHLI